MTAPSIKEALKPCPFCGGEASIVEGDECAYVQCLDTKMHRALWFKGDNNAANEVAEQWNKRPALATLQPSGEKREAIARIICYWDEPSTCHDNYCCGSCRATILDARFLKAADQIIASGLVQDEAGVRADCVSVSRDVLLTLISVLDGALGDTDPSIDEDCTDDEIKRDYPVFWVCQQLAALSHQPAPVAANVHTNSKAVFEARRRGNVFGHFVNEQLKSASDKLSMEDNASAEARWRSISKDTSWVDGRDVVLLAHDMEVQARYCPGEWSDETPSSPREYSGAVWSCFDDQFQLEIEETSKDPSEWGHDGATHWRPISTHPHASDCDKAVYDVLGDQRTCVGVPASGLAKMMDAIENPPLPNEALKKLMRDHASDCDKQGETEIGPFPGEMKKPPGPSDRTADVTVDELAHWLLHNLSLDAHPLKDARALLDAFTMGRR